MVARKSTAIDLQNKIASVNDQIRSLEAEQQSLKADLRRLRRRKQTWEVYEASTKASDRYLKVSDKIVKLYAQVSSLTVRLIREQEKEREQRAAQERERIRESIRVTKKPAPKPAPKPKVKPAPAPKPAPKPPKKPAGKPKKAAPAKGFVFPEQPAERLKEREKEHPLQPVKPLKGEAFKDRVTKLLNIEQQDWRKHFFNVGTHFLGYDSLIDLAANKDMSNADLIRGRSKKQLLDILNKGIAFQNMQKQLQRLPRLVLHDFGNEQDAEIARSYTGIELTYPEGFKPSAFIFVPDPDEDYTARIVNGVLEIEQPISRVREAFLPFTSKQFMQPKKVANEVVTRFPDAQAAFIRAGAFGLVRMQDRGGAFFGSDLGGGKKDVADGLSSAIMSLQTRYSQDGDMADQCDPDDPSSRHWKNWMTGIVVFRTTPALNILDYIDTYNKIMERRKQERKDAAAKRRKDDSVR